MLSGVTTGFRAIFFYEETEKDWLRRTSHVVLQVAAVLGAMVLTTQLLEWVNGWLPGEFGRGLMAITVASVYAMLYRTLLNASARSPMAWMSAAIFCCEISLLSLLFPYLMILVITFTPASISGVLKSDTVDLVGLGTFVASVLFGIRGWGRYIHRNARARLVAENAHLFERMAMEDALTGLPNRRSFERTIADKLTQGKERVAVLMIDVDRFKTINDGYSHEVGDHVLQGIAAVLHATVGAVGVAARLAGDEFVVGMFGLGHDEESRMIGSVEIAMAAYNWEHIAPGLMVTVSLGLARSDEAENLADMLRRGDQQMYKYKRSSRRAAAEQAASEAPLGAELP
jgi:diguanylate cyclase (GGDEF)-like protein